MKALPPQILALGVIALLGAALVLKSIRYHEAPQTSGADFNVNLTRFLDTKGWVPHSDSTAKQSSVEVLEFHKTGCTQPLRVSVVGATTGVESYLRQTYGNDIAFLQQGVIRDHPSQLRLQIDSTLVAVRDFMRQENTAVLPILAIIPAPRKSAGPCQGPTRAAWKTLELAYR